jgi:hypothetical protein
MDAFFVLLPIFSFIIILVWLNNRKNERMFLLKLGKDPNLANSKNDRFVSINYLRLGIIITCIGLGFLFGKLFFSDSDSGFFACLLIYSGIGLIVSFLTSRYDSLQEQKKNSENIDKPA